MTKWKFGRQVRIGKGQTTIPMARDSNRSTAQSLRVGENPLNGKGMPLTLFKK